MDGFHIVAFAEEEDPGFQFLTTENKKLKFFTAITKTRFSSTE